MSARDYLFSSQDGHGVQQAVLGQASKDVAHFSEEQILNTDPDELVKYLVEKYIADVPVLDLGNIIADRRECTVEVHDFFSERPVRVPGVAFDFEIPFVGDPQIFQIRPGTFDSAPPRAAIRGNSLCFTVTGRDVGQDELTRALESMKASVSKYLDWHRNFWAD